MPTVAEQLRAAREAKKLSVNEVADTTKIRTDHIRALEAGDFDVFTATVYIRGFVRCYATLLKLDVPEIMRTLDGELGQTEKFSEPPPLSSQRKGVLDFLMLQLSKLNGRKGGLVLAGAAVILLVLLVAWIGRSRPKSQTVPKLPPTTYQSGQKQSGDTLPLPKAPKK